MNEKAMWARAPSGWAEPVRLTDEQRDMIRNELSQRRRAVFRNRERQDAFLRRIEGALTYLRTQEGARPDLHLSQKRIMELHKALTDAEKALSLMGQSERAAIEHWQMCPLADFAREVTKWREQAESAADALKMTRGAHDPPPSGHVRLLVHQTADAWHRVFKRKPSWTVTGEFFPVANVVIGQIGEPEIAKDAMRTILKGAGF